MNTAVEEVTERIRERSARSRQAYLDGVRRAADGDSPRHSLSCGNLAHGMAACGEGDKDKLTGANAPNIGIVTAYNDILSAHQPFVDYPERIKRAAQAEGAVAQVAGGVPAMCDGVTQGQTGMDLSLFSRDVIALSTAVALSHDLFDAVLMLGICDKIVPGLLIGALSFGHLPCAFVPAGPMVSGLSNDEKARVREAFAAGRVGRDELLAAESAAYHSPGTCTFYGTANSNQMLMEFMGLQLPGGSFVNPGTPLREALTEDIVRRVLQCTRQGGRHLPIAHVIDEKAIVNGIVGLLATGGSTNHTIHLVAIARAAGIQIDWDDFSALSAAVPLIARVYPNGTADVNRFHACGGIGFVLGELLAAGLVHEDVQTILGQGLSRFLVEPFETQGKIEWKAAAREPGDEHVVRRVSAPFDEEGGLRVLEGNLGRAIVKVSAVSAAHRSITAPARVFPTQSAFIQAFEAGDLEGDFVAVLPDQGPRANGMPELHKLTPYLGVLQDRGARVALVTDGRMSGASGKVLAAIHVTPEARAGGLIGEVRDGDSVHIDAKAGVLRVESRGASDASREPAPIDQTGTGRELFHLFRAQVGSAEEGASIVVGEGDGRG